MATKKYTKESLVQLIQDLSNDGIPPTSTHKELPRRSVFVRYFGSWRESLKAAGFDKTHAEAVRPETRKVFGTEYRRLWYENNKEQHISNCVARNANQQRIFNEWKKTLKCSSCDETCSACLDFHHVNQDKDFELSGAAYKYGTKRILAELSKCAVLCRNCHAKVHIRALPEPDVLSKVHIQNLTEMYQK